MTSDEANDCLRNAVDFLGDLVQELRKSKKSEEQISIQFKEEFARLCENGR